MMSEIDENIQKVESVGSVLLYIVKLAILCHACLRFVNSCMTASTMSALWLHDGQEALCTINEIKLSRERELETNLTMAMAEECTLLGASYRT